MVDGNGRELRLGWIGAGGRMGSAMATHLVKGGCDVAVYNRTRSKLDPLVGLGASAVDTPDGLADRDVVFISVGGPDDLREVILGPAGLLACADAAPSVIVDMSTVSAEVSAEIRAAAAERGAALLAAPVSGNGKVVETGRLTVVASGPRAAFQQVLPYLELLGSGVTYVGDGEGARLVKICHNLFLGVVIQSLVEITVLAEKGGIARADMLAFLNDSVMGSPFTRYKTPALVNLDYTPTFTPALLLKDMSLGLEVGGDLGVPLPLAAATQEIVRSLIGSGYGDVDFSALIELEAKGAGLELKPEPVQVSDGLSEPRSVPTLDGAA